MERGASSRGSGRSARSSLSRVGRSEQGGARLGERREARKELGEPYEIENGAHPLPDMREAELAAKRLRQADIHDELPKAGGLNKAHRWECEPQSRDIL